VGQGEEGATDPETPAEIALARKLLAFTAALDQALEELRPHHLCTFMDKNCVAYAEEVAKELRNSGKNVAINYTFKSIGDQIKSATKQSIPNVIVIGEDEAKNKSYEIKKL
jgi:histidyl-tRNA synthetase